MNRELKFRAYRKKTNDMIHSEGEWLNVFFSEVEEIGEYEVMRHTGVGNIYEGDTATKTFTEKVGKHTVERTVTGEVVWSDKKAGFVLLVREYVTNDVFDQKHYELDGCTVTGNIHESQTK